MVEKLPDYYYKMTKKEQDIFWENHSPLDYLEDMAIAKEPEPEVPTNRDGIPVPSWVGNIAVNLIRLIAKPFGWVKTEAYIINGTCYGIKITDPRISHIIDGEPDRIEKSNERRFRL